MLNMHASSFKASTCPANRSRHVHQPFIRESRLSRSCWSARDTGGRGLVAGRPAQPRNQATLQCTLTLHDLPVQDPHMLLPGQQYTFSYKGYPALLETPSEAQVLHLLFAGPQAPPATSKALRASSSASRASPGHTSGFAAAVTRLTVVEA